MRVNETSTTSSSTPSISVSNSNSGGSKSNSSLVNSNNNINNHKSTSSTSPFKLYLKINAFRAADLVPTSKEDEDSKRSHKYTNPVLIAKMNTFKGSTCKKTHTNQPSWDDEIIIPLKTGDMNQLLVLSVWDKHKRYKNYLGELRLGIKDLFINNDKFIEKTELKWYKLNSNATVHSFVTGSLLLSFELITKKRKSKFKQKESLVDKLKNLKVNETELQFKKWLNSLIDNSDEQNFKTLRPNEQGFYDDVLVDLSDLESLATRQSKSNGDTASTMSDEMISNKRFLNVINNSPNGDASSMSEQSSFISSEGISDTDGRSEEKRSRFKRKMNIKKLTTENKFEMGSRKVLGVVFIEIVSCEDLPPIKNFTRTTFDMDPFVVVTFGKKTFRTSWKRHTLNPIFNERVAFEILPHENNYNIQFSVLDKDQFSFHDQVADIELPLRDLTEYATAQPTMMSRNDSELSFDLDSGFTTGDNESPSNSNVKILEDDNIVQSVRKKKFSTRKKITESTVDISKFRVMSLSLDLHDQKYIVKYAPKLKIRVRFETYDELRKQFWRVLLKQYDIEYDETNTYDFLELVSLLDALGTTNSDELVTTFYKNLNKDTEDLITYDEIIEQLEIHMSLNDQSSNKIFVFEKCPICLQKRFSRKQDIDIVTHFAICASKDWSIVNKLLVSSYVSPRQATKKWYSKALIKLTYGKYKLGGNSANILVQDRLTGLILEEKMSVYVRLGIRLLYKGLDKAKSKRVRILLRSLSIKQGKKFDSSKSKADIESFIKFHKLNLSDCLIENPNDYPTFNEFFYRKLKPNARLIEDEKNDKIVSSPADCRCVAFSSVDEATELWIKGRNFTIAKLFNGDLQDNSNIPFKAEDLSIGVFRLAPQDYHRFHSPISGTIGEIKHINGEYYTVNPIAIRSELDVFGENIRSIIPIHTEEFGTVLMIAVGAMMVGSIVLTVKPGDKIKRGDEIGYFKFGGSTIILLFNKNKFVLDSDISSNSKSSIETLVRVGQSIGHSPETDEYRRDHSEFNKLSHSKKLDLIRILTGGDLKDKHQLSNWEASKIQLESDNDEAESYFDINDEKLERDVVDEGFDEEDDDEDDEFDDFDEEGSIETNDQHNR
ncbi:PSD2 [Candida pseudojiufengensis]|uniref:PSD2 n=1 Tax=Candida pseudojiufengensis TaxID=497109 RepID=UPI002223FE4A|nr:PSD2 [Candida pseudojiufengensis]KAI5964134.1 PSD2 [Candida pseudojiufengensis]